MSSEVMQARLRRELDRLLLQRAIDGLDALAERRLTQLIARFPEVDIEGYERAAAAVLLAGLDGSAPLPEKLRQRIAAGTRGTVNAARPDPGRR